MHAKSAPRLYTNGARATCCVTNRPMYTLRTEFQLPLYIRLKAGLSSLASDSRGSRHNVHRSWEAIKVKQIGAGKFMRSSSSLSACYIFRIQAEIKLLKHHTIIVIFTRKLFFRIRSENCAKFLNDTRTSLTKEDYCASDVIEERITLIVRRMC